MLLLAGLLAIGYGVVRTTQGSLPEKPLSDLLTALDEKQVASGTFTSDGDRVDWVDARGQRHRTYITGGYAGALVDQFHANGLPFDVTPSSSSNLLLSVILPNIILFLVIGGFMWYMLRQAQRSRAG